jgi:hypothetical protein
MLELTENIADFPVSSQQLKIVWVPLSHPDNSRRQLSKNYIVVTFPMLFLPRK